MMCCPNCKQEYDGKFCPECGTKLIEKPATSGVSLNLGDANAISGWHQEIINAFPQILLNRANN